MNHLKRDWLTIALCLLLAACGMQAPSLFATTLTVSLGYTYSSSGQVDSSNDYPACSATVTTNCVTGFNVYDTTGSTPVLIGKIPNASTPTGSQTVIGTFTLSNPTYGSHTAVATTAYIGPSGTAAESADSAPATFTINPGAPNAPAAITIKVGN